MNPNVNHELPDTDEELSALVIQGLSRFRNRDRILTDVCQRTGWHWDQANEFVQDIEYEHLPEIAGKNARLILPIGIGIMLAGVAQIIIGVVMLYSMSITWFSQTRVAEESLVEFIFYSLVEMFQIAPQLLLLILSGVAFCFGGAFGLIRVVDRMRNV